MNILKEFRNNLLKRNEVDVIVESKSNPGFEGAKKFILDGFKVGEEGVVIRAVRSEFGKKEFLIEAFIYDSAEDRKKIEPRGKKREISTPAQSLPASLQEKKKKEKPVVEENKVEEDKKDNKEGVKSKEVKE